VFDRTTELIGMGDRGIVMYRNMLKQQIQLVQEGKDPDGVIRDPALNSMVRLSLNSELNKLAQEMASAK
jgi:5,5'-dehydrodivanillate O-demethylase